MTKHYHLGWQDSSPCGSGPRCQRRLHTQRLTTTLCPVAPPCSGSQHGGTPLRSQQGSIPHDSALTSQGLGASCGAGGGGVTQKRQQQETGTTVRHHTASLMQASSRALRAWVCFLVQRCGGIQAPKDLGIITSKLEG